MKFPPRILLPLTVLMAGLLFTPWLRSAISSAQGQGVDRKTVADRLEQFGASARARLKPGFDRAGISYPPTSLKLVALKAERVMQLYAADSRGSNRWISTYPILAASGAAGPKLQEGDGQVPEEPK